MTTSRANWRAAMKSLIKLGVILVVAGSTGLAVGLFTGHPRTDSVITLGVGILLLFVGTLGGKR